VSVAEISALVISLALIVYLIIALVFPERF